MMKYLRYIPVFFSCAGCILLVAVSGSPWKLPAVLLVMGLAFLTFGIMGLLVSAIIQRTKSSVFVLFAATIAISCVLFPSGKYGAIGYRLFYLLKQKPITELENLVLEKNNLVFARWSKGEIFHVQIICDGLTSEYQFESGVAVDSITKSRVCLSATQMAEYLPRLFHLMRSLNVNGVAQNSFGVSVSVNGMKDRSFYIQKYYSGCLPSSESGLYDSASKYSSLGGGRYYVVPNVKFVPFDFGN